MESTLFEFELSPKPKSMASSLIWHLHKCRGTRFGEHNMVARKRVLGGDGRCYWRWACEFCPAEGSASRKNAQGESPCIYERPTAQSEEDRLAQESLGIYLQQCRSCNHVRDGSEPWIEKA